MNIKQLTNNELVKEYKVARMCYVNAEEFTDEESEAEKKFDNLWAEIQRRNIDLRKYI